MSLSHIHISSCYYILCQKQINLENAALAQEAEEFNNEIRDVVNQKVNATEIVRNNTERCTHISS